MTYANRSADRARILAQLADELLAQRKAKPTGATQRNAIYDEPDDKPTPEAQEQDDIVKALLRRLATRDETGGGSGEGG